MKMSAASEVSQGKAGVSHGKAGVAAAVVRKQAPARSHAGRAAPSKTKAAAGATKAAGKTAAMTKAAAKTGALPRRTAKPPGAAKPAVRQHAPAKTGAKTGAKAGAKTHAAGIKAPSNAPRVARPPARTAQPVKPTEKLPAAAKQVATKTIEAARPAAPPASPAVEVVKPAAPTAAPVMPVAKAPDGPKPPLQPAAQPAAPAVAPTPAPVGAAPPERPAGPARPAAAQASVAKPAAPRSPQVTLQNGRPLPPSRAAAKEEFFVEGDYVVYPTHGVGKVERIATEDIAGHRLELIHITFEENRMTLRVPVTKARSAGLRKLATRKMFDEAMGVLRGRARIKRTMWSRRAQEYEAKINSGDPIAIAEVVRDLHRNSGQPDQSFSERQIYEAAMDRLAAELAALDQTDKPAASVKLVNYLKTV